MGTIGGGFVPIINYSGASSAYIASSKAILTESGSEILTEASDYLEYEP